MLTPIKVKEWVMRCMAVVVMAIMAMSANAQVTTSSLSGQVTEPDGEPLIGA